MILTHLIGQDPLKDIKSKVLKDRPTDKTDICISRAQMELIIIMKIEFARIYANVCALKPVCL